MKKAKLLFIFTLGSLLLSCGETTSSSLSIESSNTSSVSSTLEESTHHQVLHQILLPL